MTAKGRARSRKAERDRERWGETAGRAATDRAEWIASNTTLNRLLPLTLPLTQSVPRPYQIIALTERTDAWHEWRTGGIGSSDAATILGDNPFKSPERLLFEKQHPAPDDGKSFAMRRGAAREPAARARYCLAVGIVVVPACVQSVERDWLRASVDGLSADGGRVVEIKCGSSAHRKAVSRRRPPRHHYGQLQHILAVTGLPVIDYWCDCPPYPPLRLEVPRDNPYIERLLAAEEIFWKQIRCSERIQRSPRETSNAP